MTQDTIKDAIARLVDVDNQIDDIKERLERLRKEKFEIEMDLIPYEMKIVTVDNHNYLINNDGGLIKVEYL